MINKIYILLFSFLIITIIIISFKLFSAYSAINDLTVQLAKKEHDYLTLYTNYNELSEIINIQNNKINEYKLKTEETTKYFQDINEKIENEKSIEYKKEKINDEEDAISWLKEKRYSVHF